MSFVFKTANAVVAASAYLLRVAWVAEEFSIQNGVMQDFDSCKLDVEHKGSTKLLELPNSRLTGRPQQVSMCYSTRWSPDGTYLAISSERQARLQMWYALLFVLSFVKPELTR